MKSKEKFERDKDILRNMILVFLENHREELEESDISRLVGAGLCLI